MGWKSSATSVGACVAIVSGLVQYAMTGGLSGWVPLISGSLGAIVGPLLFHFWNRLITSGQPVTLGIADLTGLRGDIPKNLASATPKVIPIQYKVTDDGIEGLRLKNVGEGHALDVTVSPLLFGLWAVSFTGPEVTYLEENHTCFFGISVEGPPTPLTSGLRLFRVLRGWQSETEEWDREITGFVRYKDLNGVGHETIYRIGVDVLNRESGLVLRVVREPQAKR